MSGLSTEYLGMKLRCPLAASAGPLGRDLGNLRALEDAGIAAIVLHSLFEEQIDLEGYTLDHRLTHGTDSYAEALTFFPEMPDYNIGPGEYLEHLAKAKQAVHVPVIASLNGASAGGWVRYAKLMEQAGADALELNIYDLPTDPVISGAAIENGYCELVRQVSASVRIPVAVKIGPYFSSIPHVARQLDRSGARGLVLFNRFYQPDFDLESLEVVPNLRLSDSNELLLRLHWAAILYGKTDADLAITGGVHTVEDALKAMMAGARVAMMTSALLLHGIAHAARLERGIAAWMEAHEYESIRQMRGSMSYQSVANPAPFERANYLKVLGSYPPVNGWTGRR